jgi:integrase
MLLSDVQCKNAKAESKPRKIFDGGGLFLQIEPNGSKYWRFKYNFLGKEKRMAFGVYPEVSLADARGKRDRARKLLSEDIDPNEAKKEGRRKAALNAINTFEAVAREWHENQSERWSAAHQRHVLHKLETDIFPYLGKRPIADIDAPELLVVLRKIEKRGALHMAKRARGICGQILRYGIATGRCKRDLSIDLRDALKTKKPAHYSALDIKEMPDFLRALECNDARLYGRTRRAVRMLMYTFVRTSELIEATWDEFDLEAHQWNIPAERMKMRRPHIVPMSRQVVQILNEQKQEVGHLNSSYIFPSQIRPRESMSNNTILFAIKRLGYKGRMTGHGFRALARTSIRENLGYEADVIERQLAHAHESKIVAAYDRAQFIDKRRVMMQNWADFVDSLTNQQKIVYPRFGGTVADAAE